MEDKLCDADMDLVDNIIHDDMMERVEVQDNTGEDNHRNIQDEELDIEYNDRQVEVVEVVKVVFL